MTNAIDEDLYNTGINPDFYRAPVTGGGYIGVPKPFTMQPDIKIVGPKPQIDFKTLIDSTKLDEPSVPADPLAEVQGLIADTCDEIKNLLLEKNRKYGNSALEPSRIFSRADSVEQIKVRLDDKLTRLKNAQGDEDEDVVQDLMGYLVLLRVAQKLKQLSRE